MEYPKKLDNDAALHPELTWRDFNMHNMNIQHDKMLYLKDQIDIIDTHRFVDDFCNLPDVTYIWDLLESPGTSGVDAVACADEVDGVLELVTEGDDDDNGELVQQCECWKLVDCYPLYAELRFKLSDAEQSDFWFGLITGAAGWFAGPPNDYVVFNKDDGDNNLDFVNDLTGAAAAVDTDTGVDLVDDTWYRVAFHWDGGGTIRWWVIADGDFPQTILATGTVTTAIPTTEMTIGFGVQAGEQGAKTLSVDYLKIAQKRVIE